MKEFFFFHLFLNRYEGANKQKLLALLSDSDRENIEKREHKESKVLSFLFHRRRFLDSLHYSWLTSALSSLSPALRSLVGEVLTEEQMKGLKVSFPPQTHSETTASFLKGQLFKHLTLEEPLPVDCLQDSELKILLSWDKHQIVELIEFLGLLDLASELKKIVDKNALKNVFKSLTPKQLQCLKLLLHQKEKLVSPKLDIDLMKTDKETLLRLLHQRGLYRLSKALFGESPDFVFHLAYKLDTGRGKVLLKEYQKEAIPKVALALKQQVSQMINFLKDEA